MSGYEVVTCDVEHRGVMRTVKMIRDPQTLDPYFPASIWLMNEYHRAPSGYDQIAHRVANFLTFAQGKGESPLSVDKYFLEAYCDKHLYREKGLEANTVKQYHTSISHFYRGMQKLGFIEKAVEVREFLNSKLQAEIDMADGIRDSLDPFNLYQKYLTHEDFEMLAGSVRRKSARLRRRDELILRVAYETGCRASEVVDPDNFSISRLRSALQEAEKQCKSEFLYPIIGKGRGLGKTRKIAFPTALAKDILRYVTTFKIPGDIVFGSQKHAKLHQTYPSKLFKECKDQILIYGDVTTPNLNLWIAHKDSRTFHSLRHTYATNLANKLRALGESHEQLRERMGHNNYQTTRVYINFEILLHGSPEEQDELRAHAFNTLDCQSYDELCEGET